VTKTRLFWVNVESAPTFDVLGETVTRDGSEESWTLHIVGLRNQRQELQYGRTFSWDSTQQLVAHFIVFPQQVPTEQSALIEQPSPTIAVPLQTRLIQFPDAQSEVTVQLCPTAAPA
jgi:hypothetical protein